MFSSGVIPPSLPHTCSLTHSLSFSLTPSVSHCLSLSLYICPSLSGLSLCLSHCLSVCPPLSPSLSFLFSLLLYHTHSHRGIFQVTSHNNPRASAAQLIIDSLPVFLDPSSTIPVIHLSWECFLPMLTPHILPWQPAIMFFLSHNTLLILAGPFILSSHSLGSLFIPTQCHFHGDHCSIVYLFMAFSWWWNPHKSPFSIVIHLWGEPIRQCLFNTLRPRQNDKISQTFSNVFSWMKMYELRLIFHWSLYLRVKLIFQHWCR